MRRFKDEDRGAVLIIVAILLPVLIGVLALVGDLGFQIAARRQVVTAADAASLAAAQACSYGHDPAAAVQELVTANLADAPGVSEASGTITNLTGSCDGLTSGHLTVTTHATVSRFFAGILGIGPGSVSSTATAEWTVTAAVPGPPVVGNPSNGGNGQGGGHTKVDPQSTGQDCSHNAVGGPAPGGNPDHCPEPERTVRLVG